MNCRACDKPLEECPHRYSVSWSEFDPSLFVVRDVITGQWAYPNPLQSLTAAQDILCEIRSGRIKPIEGGSR